MNFTNNDIRGFFGDKIDCAFARNLGFVIAEHLGYKGQVVVGYDSRLSSIPIRNCLLEAITDAGVDVIDISMCTTPMVYFAQKFFDTKMGVMITASHNPIEYNGFKIINAGKSFSWSNVELRLAKAALPLKKNKGRVILRDILDVYSTRLSNLLQGGKQLKIAWDCGGGAVAMVIAKLRVLVNKHMHVLINEKIDPARTSDSSKEGNLYELADCVRRNKCDVGFAFDTDADRVGMVDSNGSVVLIDHIVLALLAEFSQMGKYVLDVKLSSVVKKYVETSIGGEVVEFPAGRSGIIKFMLEEDVIFAAESSGHIFFAENKYDDGVFAAMKVANLIASKSKPFSDLPKCLISPEIRIRSSNPLRVVAALKSRLIDERIEFSMIDGVRVDYPFGWWLVRASNTEAALVIRFEGYNEQGFLKVKKILDKYVIR